MRLYLRKGSTMQSKSFAAQLPALTPAERDRLRAWGGENCSRSVFLSRRKLRHVARKPGARATRGVLKRLPIDAPSLRRRRWLTLTEDLIVRAECAPQAAVDQPQGSLSDVEVRDEQGGGVRVVPVGRR